MPETKFDKRTIHTFRKTHGKRGKAPDLVVDGVRYPTIPNYAVEINTPVAVVRAWANDPVNPLPTIRLPSADPRRKPQIRRVNTPLLPGWLASFAQQPPRKRRA